MAHSSEKLLIALGNSEYQQEACTTLVSS